MGIVFKENIELRSQNRERTGETYVKSKDQNITTLDCIILEVHFLLPDPPFLVSCLMDIVAICII